MIHIGVSGWRYPRWRGDFYPAGLRQADELSFLSHRMNSAEINRSFYSLLRPELYRRWHDATPESFTFAVKGSRFITHMRRLQQPESALANFFASGPLALGSKLGPFLWQLPGSLHFDRERVEHFVASLPRTTCQAAELAGSADPGIVPDPYLEMPAGNVGLRHAVEVRHDSYLDRGFYELLRTHDVALVVSDAGGRHPRFDEPTATFTYVRLHGPQSLYHGSYRPDRIAPWAHRVRAWSQHGDVFLFFDNDSDGAAPWDALALARDISG